MEEDTRGKENTERNLYSSRRNVGGLVKTVLAGALAAVMAAGCALLPGKIEKDFARLPDGKIVHFLKPVARITTNEGDKRDVYEIDSESGKGYIEFSPSIDLINYNKKDSTITIYDKYTMGGPEIRKIKIPSEYRKIFKSIEGAEEYINRPRKVPAGCHPSIFLSR